MLKIFSFFSGCGFLDLGFEMYRDKFEIQLVNEISPSFLSAYKYSRKNMHIPSPVFGYDNIDVNCYLNGGRNKLTDCMQKARNSGDLIGFIGGPPCPDFSVAGKQKGSEGKNGKLTSTYVELILTQTPDFFLFENVKGLMTTAKHRLFYEQIKEQLGTQYALTDRLCNALEFGVPQDRDRIFLFGLKKCYAGNSGVITDFPWNEQLKYNLNEVKALNWPITTPFDMSNTLPCPKDVALELTVNYWFKKNHVQDHPNSEDFFTPQAGLKKMLEISEGDCTRKCYKRLHRWRYSPTVAYGNNEVHLHPYKARRLSAAEAMALQSLPDNFMLPQDMTLTDKFKTIGNGVPFLMAHGVANAIAKYLDRKC